MRSRDSFMAVRCAGREAPRSKFQAPSSKEIPSSNFKARPHDTGKRASLILSGQPFFYPTPMKLKSSIALLLVSCFALSLGETKEKPPFLGHWSNGRGETLTV